MATLFPYLAPWVLYLGLGAGVIWHVRWSFVENVMEQMKVNAFPGAFTFFNFVVWHINHARRRPLPGDLFSNHAVDVLARVPVSFTTSEWLSMAWRIRPFFVVCLFTGGVLTWPLKTPWLFRDGGEA